MLQTSIISTRIILYASPSKPTNELFPCIYFATYSYLLGCCLCNTLTSRTSMARHCSGLSSIILPAILGFVPQQLNSRQNGKFCGHHVKSLLGSLMLSSVHSTIIITNALINQAGSCYIITNFYIGRRQLYRIIWMISMLLHLTLAPPRSYVITMTSSF